MARSTISRISPTDSQPAFTPPPRPGQSAGRISSPPPRPGHAAFIAVRSSLHMAAGRISSPPPRPGHAAGRQISSPSQSPHERGRQQFQDLQHQLHEFTHSDFEGVSDEQFLRQVISFAKEVAYQVSNVRRNAGKVTGQGGQQERDPQDFYHTHEHAQWRRVRRRLEQDLVKHAKIYQIAVNNRDQQKNRARSQEQIEDEMDESRDEDWLHGLRQNLLMLLQHDHAKDLAHCQSSNWESRQQKILESLVQLKEEEQKVERKKQESQLSCLFTADDVFRDTTPVANSLQGAGRKGKGKDKGKGKGKGKDSETPPGPTLKGMEQFMGHRPEFDVQASAQQFMQQEEQQQQRSSAQFSRSNSSTKAQPTNARPKPKPKLRAPKPNPMSLIPNKAAKAKSSPGSSPRKNSPQRQDQLKERMVAQEKERKKREMQAQSKQKEMQVDNQQRQMQAAAKIQDARRKSLARRQDKQAQQDEEHQKRMEAAMKIQKIQRGHHTRASLTGEVLGAQFADQHLDIHTITQTKEKAAKRIQSLRRSITTRKETHELYLQKQREMEATKKIQALVRGSIARKQAAAEREVRDQMKRELDFIDSVMQKTMPWWHYTARPPADYVPAEKRLQYMSYNDLGQYLPRRRSISPTKKDFLNPKLFQLARRAWKPTVPWTSPGKAPKTIEGFITTAKYDGKATISPASSREGTPKKERKRRMDTPKQVWKDKRKKQSREASCEDELPREKKKKKKKKDKRQENEDEEQEGGTSFTVAEKEDLSLVTGVFSGLNADSPRRATLSEELNEYLEPETVSLSLAISSWSVGPAELSEMF